VAFLRAAGLGPCLRVPFRQGAAAPAGCECPDHEVHRQQEAEDEQRDIDGSLVVFIDLPEGPGGLRLTSCSACEAAGGAAPDVVTRILVFGVDGRIIGDRRFFDIRHTRFHA